MYFSEPQPTAADLHFQIFGIPVRVSPWFWLGTAIFGWGLVDGDPKKFLIWEVAVFLSILVHELGHALVMRGMGDRPHIVLVFLGGLAVGRAGRSSKDQILVSAAGPFAQIMLAALTIGIVRASGHSFPYQIPFWRDDWYDLNGIHLPELPYDGLNFFLFCIVWPSIVWAVINLVPVFPLDGGQIARAALSLVNPFEGVRWSLMLSIAAGAAVAFYGFKIQQPYMGMMFALLAYDSYNTYQQIGGGWRRY
jgi:Zn-dependent protease